jgi:hypothetical protein
MFPVWNPPKPEDEDLPLQRLRIELLFILQSPPDALAEPNRPGGHKAMGVPRVRSGYKDTFEVHRQASPRGSRISRQ